MSNIDWNSIKEYGKVREPTVTLLKGLSIHVVKDLASQDNFFAEDDPEYSLVRWCLEHKRIKLSSRVLLVNTDAGDFWLCYPYQITKFNTMYHGKEMIYLKVNPKGYYEIAMSKKDIDDVMELVKKKATSTVSSTDTDSKKPKKSTKKPKNQE